MLKILHTSDIQLDAPFDFLGSKGPQHRQQLRETFKRIVDLASQDGFDLLLIAGDLFNDNRPRQETIDFVAFHLSQLAIPVCVLPGNHDCYDDASVYRKAGFRENVTVFTEQPTIQGFPDLDVTVYGNPILSVRSRLSPLRGLTPTGGTRWHVAMAHGNFVRPDIVDPPRPILSEEIRASGMNYVAMGDWHAFSDHSQGGVKALYSGAPEPTTVDQKGAGYVACVEISEQGVSVQKKRVGSISADAMEIDTSGRTIVQFAEEIKRHADPQLMLRVTLGGLVELGTVLDTEKLESDLAPDFYHIECSNQSHPQLAAISPDDYPEELVIGKFVRLMRSRIGHAADDTHRRLVEQALQLGVALLKGKQVL